MRCADMGPKGRLLLVAFFLAGLLKGPAFAQTAAPSPSVPSPMAGLPAPDFKSEASLDAAVAELDRSAGTVVADVGGRSVTWGDVADAIRAMPRVVSAIPFQELYQSATVQVMQEKALAQLGESTGLDKDPVVQRRIKNAAEQAMATEVLRRSLAPNITGKSLRALYDGVVAGKPGPDEVDARIIVVDTKAEAADLIQQIKGGGDFSTLARKSSKDGTADRGGDLGYTRLDMLAPELGSVVFALGLGQITEFPVKSGNFWFIVKVEGRRQPSAPSFAEARPVLEQDMLHAGIPELKRVALQQSVVKYYGLAGKKQTDAAPK
jgi:peptidyl-prolyl cis-trans isomerase C